MSPTPPDPESVPPTSTSLYRLASCLKRFMSSRVCRVVHLDGFKPFADEFGEKALCSTEFGMRECNYSSCLVDKIHKNRKGVLLPLNIGRFSRTEIFLEDFRNRLGLPGLQSTRRCGAV